MASTLQVPKSAKMEYWNQALSEIWGHIQIEPTNLDIFEGRIKSVKANRFVFNEISYRGHNIHRTPGNIAKMNQDFYVLAFPFGDPWQMNLGKETFTLKRGNAYLLCNTVPYKSNDKNGYDTFNVMIPSQLLRNLIPTLETRYVLPLNESNKKANILHSFVRSLYGHLPLSGEEDTRFMENNLLNLLAFVLQEKSQGIDANDSSVKLAHRERILEYISAHYSQESMSPESIARQHGISVSYLHRVFKPYGKTVLEVMREKRLQAAKRQLSNPDLAGLSVTEIAYRVGFKHPSDFSRAYKARYGRSPKDAREAPAED
ncbi:MAG: helix-turn-helix domain-containing protein [Deltaproteobacteria bacterium]|nr:helix-turn-helix domain-containing protein [Deltaproteobacteria bacterium]